MFQTDEAVKQENIYKCYITNDAGRTSEQEAGEFVLKFGKPCDESPRAHACCR